MKWKTIITGLTAAVFLSSAAAAKTVNFGSSNPGSMSHSTCAAIAKLVNSKLKLQTRVIPYGGQSAFVPAVNTGELDFGAANVYELSEALSGTGIYKGRVLGNLRAVAVLYPMRTAVWVRKDSPIKSIRDLKGKRFPGGFSAQKTIRDLNAGWLANGGLTYNDVKMVPEPNVNRAAEDFAQGELAAFSFGVGAGKVLEAGAKVGGLRALPLDTSPEAIARFRKYVPAIYPLLVKPSKANYGILQPTYLGAIDFILITNKNVPDDLVYKVTKVIYGGKKAFLASFKPLGALFSQENMDRKLFAGEYHPGAIKFYKEVGLWPPKE